MKIKVSWVSLLYLGIALIAAAAISLGMIVVPGNSSLPAQGINAIWVNIVIQLLIIVSLLWIIRLRKKGNYKKELLVITAVVAIIMGLIIIDGVAATLGDELQHQVGIWMLINSICDLLAAVVLMFARYLAK